MCRLVAYLGRSTLLKNILVSPKNSIVMQSLHALETNLRTNGDGFGLGWYVPEISTDPALFTSIYPAWNDRNLLNLTAKIESPCFFAHVRSASLGGVTNYNCHPFVHGDWMLMHNGELFHFLKIERHLRHMLDDDIYHWIKGETDSEHLFALFLQLAKGKDLSQLSVVADVLVDTFQKIENLTKEFSHSGPSEYNVCLTDGQRIIATRYNSHTRKKPLSMHYFLGEATEEKPDYVIVSSEKLDHFDPNWQEVPAQHMLLIDEKRTIQLRPL